MAVLLVVLALSLKTPAWGADARGFIPDPVASDTENKRITLSLKIAEATGKETSRKYFRSLLRQKKRNPLRQISPGQSGFPPVP
jgi:hypothetical protein